MAMQLADASLHTTNSTLPFLVDERRSVHVNVMLASNRNGGWRHSHVDVTAGTITRHTVDITHQTITTRSTRFRLTVRYERGYAVQVS